MRIPEATLLLAVLAPVLVAQEPSGPTRGRLREVRITTGDVFADRTAQRYALADLVNALHWVTREETIRREVWMQPGEVVTAAEAAELERNLRALGLFADVEVHLVATHAPDTVDLEVITRDKLTLTFGAGASHVGGVTGYRASVGESNLLGFGNRIAASFTENTEDEFRGSVAYTDLHVLDTWHTGTVRVSRTEEGDSIAVDLRRPFKHLADPRTYGMFAAHDDGEVEYYRMGDSVAQVDDRAALISLDFAWGSGPEDRRRTDGFVLTMDSHDYAPATGPLAPSIRVPGDTQSVFAGFRFGRERIGGYRKVEGLDTIDYVQDLTLGFFYGATVGARWRDETGAGSDLQPEVAGNVSWAGEPFSDFFANFEASGRLRWDSGDAVGWNTSLGAWLFALTSSINTVGTSITFDAVEETQDLPVELTLGEDNGLRGYPGRFFSGTRRLRINVEDRIDTGISILTFRVGAVAFFDAGWMGDDGHLGSPWESVGIGLRVGSKPLMGDGLLRVDLAHPLDEVPGETDDWSLSVTIGQVFTFGGNASTLSAR